MRRIQILWLLVPTFALACSTNPDRDTLAKLRHVEPDLAEVHVEDGLDQAMRAYRDYLDQTPTSSLTPEAMRRLADLKLEKEYGYLGVPDATALPSHEIETVARKDTKSENVPASPASIADLPNADHELAERIESEGAEQTIADTRAIDLPLDENVEWSGPKEAIELYDQILAAYPHYENNDQVLYQKARAYDELGRNDEAILVMGELIEQFPNSRYLDEVQFRRAEYFFTRKKYLDAEDAYAAVIEIGPGTQFYELSLYKLGWTLYKQEMHEEALAQYITLLDYKVSIGYDFEQTADEASQRRVSDTYRVVSLSFSSIGGPSAVSSYFDANGPRSYEDRIYSHLGEFYFEKLRYQDAAGSYTTFVSLYPLHPTSPHFSMRVVEIYEEGGFPKLVLESKKAFAANYGLESTYWLHFDIEQAPEVMLHLRENLEDLATHYHARYQDPEFAREKEMSFVEGGRWYRTYLRSFPADPGTPGIHYQLSDLLLENQDFGAAAIEYEHTAYGYPTHERSSGAGYAAIFAHRENLKRLSGEAQVAVQQQAVTSTVRFVDTFPDHEHAAPVLGAAVDDLFEMKDYPRAIATGHRLIEQYPAASTEIRHSAWAVVAHSCFETEDFVQAEQAYAQVLTMTPEDDDAQQGFVDNFAASIYKQAELARAADAHRIAADHFLRIAVIAPTSAIRPVAEYDAGAALIHLKEWNEAAVVLERFRESHPEHELNREATRQLAFVFREADDPARAAEEYERVSNEAEDPELRREALLVAGELHEEAEQPERALALYQRYVDQFPEPLETGVETRFKIAELHAAAGSEKARVAELRRIVAIDRKAGDARSDRIRYLAARSALVLTEPQYERFAEVALVHPFEKNLRKKQKRMKKAIDAFGELVDYEVGEVTAATTYYIAEIYREFSRALLESERPKGLDATELDDYEMALEEEAFPFEDQSIEVHEKNLELMLGGIYNHWIEKSLDELAVLMPGRYAKFESSSGLIASLDRYAYKLPVHEAKNAGEKDASPAQPENVPTSHPDVEEAPISDEEEQLEEVAVAG